MTTYEQHVAACVERRLGASVESCALSFRELYYSALSEYYHYMSWIEECVVRPLALSQSASDPWRIQDALLHLRKTTPVPDDILKRYVYDLSFLSCPLLSCEDDTVFMARQRERYALLELLWEAQPFPERVAWGIQIGLSLVTTVNAFLTPHVGHRPTDFLEVLTAKKSGGIPELSTLTFVREHSREIVDAAVTLAAWLRKHDNDRERASSKTIAQLLFIHSLLSSVREDAYGSERILVGVVADWGESFGLACVPSILPPCPLASPERLLTDIKTIPSLIERTIESLSEKRDIQETLDTLTQRLKLARCLSLGIS